ncbi:MAG: hypothetical protein C0404_04670 [Verrucomicrobia bacterium]|nr:hypothetical protein [Verrucomicrobiota bacterium]
MRNRCLVFAAALFAGACVVFPTVSDRLYAGENRAPAGEAKPPEPAERSVFIDIPEQFKTLERAPVLFPHDKHTAELKAEGCGVCHPKKDNKFEFTYPMVRDEHNRNAFMNSFHDACIKCHTTRKKEGKESGPVNCGECHSEKAAYRPEKYLPKMPEYYSALRDTYHKNCIACHQSPAKSAEDARGLDWKTFYVKEKERVAIEFPKVFFDYYLHDKHDKALEKKCENCHYLAPELKQKLAAENKKPTSQDWLREVEKGGSLVNGDEAHARCINCHLKSAAEKKKAGPTFCKDCHSGVVRTAEQMKGVPRQEYDALFKLSFLIRPANTNDSRMAAVAFDHKAHQARSRGCQECHHSTLEACEKCHTVKGDEKGKMITLPEAFHDPSSSLSCVGCHEKQKKKPDCAGCHSLRPAGLQQSSCTTCHGGSLERLDNPPRKVDTATLFPVKLKDELEAGLLAKEYEPSKFKHKALVKALADVSDKSTLATYFHKSEMTTCIGCHHMGPVEKGKPVAACSTCHTTRQEPEKNTPTLLGAYHQSCLGCHQQMNRPEEKMPRKCEGCHKEKKAAAKP